MIKKIIIVLMALFTSILLGFSATAPAHNKVVVIPMGGGSGNAEVEDVLVDKTFSNSTGDGLTGKRPPAPVSKTGQKGANRVGDDGDLERGVDWPVPRFNEPPLIVFGVLDRLTGLSWQKSPSATYRNWSNAVDYCNLLDTGFLSLKIDDWRLPNIKELLSLIDYSSSNPALPQGHPFNLEFYYWSSTSTATDATWAVLINILSGEPYSGEKTIETRRNAWCVRGGLN